MNALVKTRWLVMLAACLTACAPRSASLRPAGPGATIAALPSPLTLDDAEEGALHERGFVISDRLRFSTFAQGWLAIFKADLPLFISADALMHVVHRSYDSILKDLEQNLMIPKLDGMLAGMRNRLAGAEGAALPARTRADADFFLGIAVSLLDESPPVTRAGADAQEMEKAVALATKAEGPDAIQLLGEARTLDFSQLKPRGHYTDESQKVPGTGGLPAYFRAVMWLGRTDARLTIPADDDKPLELHRRGLELACALRAVMGPKEMAQWQSLETTMDTFVGPRDAMGPSDVDRLYADLGISSFAALAKVPDQRILDALERGKYGKQRILSDLHGGNPDKPGNFPSTFSFTGQRYIVDSHVFSELVHDRVAWRMMPNPLDVAYAALRNDQARTLLKKELAQYRYEPNLLAARARTEANGPQFWSSSLYNLWLGALRALSTPKSSELPPFARSEAWGRRILNTQLASWAELRHDTILYAKQSYTSVAICSFPDVYVDPYPELYARLDRFGELGRVLVEALDFEKNVVLKNRVAAFFSNLSGVAQKLGAMAARQRGGERPTKEDLEFVNHAVAQKTSIGCGVTTYLLGWYIDLFYGGGASEFYPTIADVHTQPTDPTGTPVGHVLHVATGFPRVIVVDLDSSRRFVGLVSSYSEITTKDFQRMNDEEWKSMLTKGGLRDVPWMTDLVAR